MSSFGNYVMPAIIFIIVAYGLYKKVNPFDCFVEGGKEGIMTAVKLAPTLIGLIVGVTMLSYSGALELASRLLRPVSKYTGIPAELLPMALIRPFSGSGALALFENILKDYGADSYIGRIASVMMGSTETTFYATTVYYGAVHISETRHTVPAALTADFLSYVLAVTTVNLFFV